jgi:hypothetical protein
MGCEKREPAVVRYGVHPAPTIDGCGTNA